MDLKTVTPADLSEILRKFFAEVNTEKGQALTRRGGKIVINKFFFSWIILDETACCKIRNATQYYAIYATQCTQYTQYKQYYYTSDSLWKIWLVESIQSIHNSLWTWHDKCNICSRYCIYHVKFNVCLVTKPLGVFSSETKWLNAWLLPRVEDTAEVQQ